jgi:hypothetical protein
MGTVNLAFARRGDPLSYHPQPATEFYKAIADFDHALRLDPRDLQASRGRAWVMSQSGRSRADALHDTKAAANDPKATGTRDVRTIKISSFP